MCSVLIVECNDVFRRSFKEILKLYLPTLRISESVDGSDALGTIARTSPDMVFIGIRLPGRSGLELTREIKDRHPHVTVSILTNYDMPEYRITAQQYGADHFLLKDSMTGAEIAALVKDVAERRKRRSPGRRETHRGLGELVGGAVNN